MNILNHLNDKIKMIVGEDTFEFISHAKNYISATFFTKGLMFISIPILTRLLTPEEYGILSIFTSIISISTIILGLNFNGSIVRYFHEDNNDFEMFIFNNFIFLLFFDLIIFYIIDLYKVYISNLIGIETNIFLIAILVSILKVPFNLYLYYLRASKKSKQYSVISIVRRVFLLVVSILLIYLLSENKYYGKIYGELFIGIITFFVSIYYLIKLSDPKIEFEHIKYSLFYGVPLIPHALSGFILSYFDRIIINQISGGLSTGLYSFAYNIGMIMNLIVMAMNKAWIPIFYDNLEAREYKKIDELAKNYSSYVFFAAAVLILFSNEVVLIFADKSYHEALSLVPVIIFGYIFVFLYTLFGNYSFYRKKTGLISIASLSAAIINAGLNYLFIPRFGYSSAAYTTLFSYFLLFVFHYINAKFIIKEEIIALREILVNMSKLLMAISLYYFLKHFIDSYYLLLIVKFVITIILSNYLILKFRIK